MPAKIVHYPNRKERLQCEPCSFHSRDPAMPIAATSISDLLRFRRVFKYLTLHE